MSENTLEEEKALMFAVQRGQLDKLAVLFERNHLSLFHYFLRTGNGRAASEDLVQETFMKVLAYRASFNGSAGFRSWLFGIARNTMADHYRKNKSARDHVDIDEHEDTQGPTLGQQVEQDEKAALFERALTSLPLELREILILSRYHQLPYEDIAALTDCNLNTLKSRMRKAISLLRQAFAELSGQALSAVNHGGEQ